MPFELRPANCLAVYLIESGSRAFRANAFCAGSLLFFVPYQHVRLAHDSPVDGQVVPFHANFL